MISLLSLWMVGVLATAPAESLQGAQDLNEPLLQALRERRHEDAERLARRQLALRRAYGEGRDLQLATSLTYLSLAARNLGDVAEAEESAREALSIMLELYGRDNGGSATALSNLAGALRLKGDLVGAEALYRESLQLQTKQFGADAPRLSGTHNNLGALLGQLGDTVGSEEQLRRAATLARQHYGEEHPNVALAHVNLANALRGQLRPEAALEELDRAESLYQTLGDSTGWAGARLTRVRTLLDLGQITAAAGEATALLSFHASLPHQNPLSVARAQALLGQALLFQSRHGEALRVLRPAAEALEQRFGPSHPETVNVSIDLARTLLESGDGSALPLLERLSADYESARSRLAVSRSRATVDLSSPYELLARARLAAGDELGAWQATERQRGRVLEELLDLSASALPPELQRRRKALLGSLSDLEQEMLRFDESEVVDDALRRRRREELLLRQAEWSQLQREIVALRPERPRQPSLEELARALPRDAVLVGWIEGHAYCVRPGGELDWVRTRPDQGRERDALQRALRAPLNAPAFVAPSVDEELRGLMRELYEGQFSPLEPLLRGLNQIFAMPGRNLRGIPLDVLLDREGRYLGERFDLRVLPSTHFLGRQAGSEGQIENALFVGDPPFDGGPSRRYAELPRLMHSAAEIQSCASNFATARRLMGEQASESTLRDLLQRGELQRFDVLHIATHALADARQPGRSTLVLSQHALQDPVEAVLAGRPVLDGAISAAEIARNWKLDAELVTLSACESGLGRHAEGEGYLGFAHSLFEAGARRVLVSLWPVDDEATALLMERFYSLWVGEEMPPAAALREAKRWLRQSEGGRFEHPYFWAPFVLLGA